MNQQNKTEKALKPFMTREGLTVQKAAPIFQVQAVSDQLVNCHVIACMQPWIRSWIRTIRFKYTSCPDIQTDK